MFSFFSTGSRTLLARVERHPQRILQLHPGRQGFGVELEEADLQNHRQVRRAHPGLLQDPGVLETARVKGLEPSNPYKWNQS